LEVLAELAEAADAVVALGDTKGEQRELKEWLDRQLRSRYRCAGLTEPRVALWREAHEGRDDEPFVRLQAPVFVARRGGRGSRDIVTRNERLEQFGFQKRVDPYAAYQELAMYLAGPLAGQEDPGQEIGDEILASMKGFDERSFRMDSPGKKGERRGEEGGEGG
jgi:hypothetical protein